MHAGVLLLCEHKVINTILCDFRSSRLTLYFKWQKSDMSIIANLLAAHAFDLVFVRMNFGWQIVQTMLCLETGAGCDHSCTMLLELSTQHK